MVLTADLDFAAILPRRRPSGLVLSRSAAISWHPMRWEVLFWLRFTRPRITLRTAPLFPSMPTVLVSASCR